MPSQMLNPADKYDAFPRLYLPNRKWPNRALTKAPRWLSTDLRDGNQALAEPMDGDSKLRLFQFLVQMGYKEIEVSYPSASQTEYDFTRRLITTGAIPDDVTIQVMAPAREDLIRTTIESVRGAKRVILHIHVSTSPCFQDVVFNLGEDDMVALAVRCTALARSLTKDSPDPAVAATEWTLEFTPENFQDTRVEFGLAVCEAVKRAWRPSRALPIIFNLTSTVEVAMPNVFADQVEFFCDHITERDKVCVSLHNHNDRGCAVAAAEMSQLAGADRVEGCLFGNGERTGNVDLVTLGMNLFTQGIDPGIDFSNINKVVHIIEELTRIPVHPRAPYAGKLVFCTFTGTHQDAIRKGYKRRESLARKLRHAPKWRMPYLPMDPADLGRKHEAVIRLNSQSGKGGIAWYFSDVFHVEMPRELEVAFTKVVKTHANSTRREVDHDTIEELFRKSYMQSEKDVFQLLSCSLTEHKTRDDEIVQDGLDGATSVNEENHNGLNGRINIFHKGHMNGDAHHTNGYINGHSKVPKTHTIGTSDYMNGGPVQQIYDAGISFHADGFNGHASGTNGYSNHNTEPSLNGQSPATVTLTARVAVGPNATQDIRAEGCDRWASLPPAFRQLGHTIDILSHKTVLSEDPHVLAGPQKTAAFVKVALADAFHDGDAAWGVAMEEDPTRASVQAVLNAVQRLMTPEIGTPIL